MPEFTWFLNIFLSVNKKNSFSSTFLSQDSTGSHQTHHVELHLVKKSKIRACCGYEDGVDGDDDMMSRVCRTEPHQKNPRWGEDDDDVMGCLIEFDELII